jgi:L-amino acid N-acyltransferase YncA
MLKIVHLELKDANTLVEQWHRHHKPVVGHRFSIGVENDGRLCGACIVGRPVARMVDYKQVVEVTRLVTDGTKNACSLLYAAAARAAKELGYKRIQTYILDSEPGTSLIAAGWTFEGMTATRDRNWNDGQRKDRREDQPMVPKQRWCKILEA